MKLPILFVISGCLVAGLVTGFVIPLYTNEYVAKFQARNSSRLKDYLETYQDMVQFEGAEVGTSDPKTWSTEKGKSSLVEELKTIESRRSATNNPGLANLLRVAAGLVQLRLAIASAEDDTSRQYLAQAQKNFETAGWTDYSESHLRDLIARYYAEDNENNAR
ncbi:MAG TPA: hypothetical protein VK738_19000 [Terriglobales bacterium]|jgi:hypothetical protein|nr:hypothetical protein [Terriglobales bacterium]